jgi:hypothetical protein
MLGEPTYSDGGRIGFKGGTKFDPTKRSFLKIAAGLAALPFVGKFFKWAKPAAKVLTKVPIEQTGGMPVWFPKLVNKVVNEGTDVTKKLGTVEREIVHTKKIGAKGTYAGDEVTVYRNLDSGNVRVEYGPPLLDEQGKIIRASNDNAVINLEYKAPVEDITSKGKPIKTKSEFSAVESEPEVVNWEGDIEFSGENVVNRVEDLVTDTSELQKYATGKKLTIKELSESMNKQKYKNKLETDVMEQVDYIENKGGGYASMEDILDEGKRVGDLDPKGYDPQNVVKGQNLPKEYHERQIKEYMEKTKKASGGRVPFFKGKIAKGLASLGKPKPKPKGKIWKDETGETKGMAMGFSPEEMKGLDQAMIKGMAMSNAMKKLGFNPASSKDYFAFEKLVEGGMSGVSKEMRTQILKAKYGDVLPKDLLDNMIATDDPQKLATVMGTVDEAKIMQERGMGTDEIIQTMKESLERFSKRKKQASGGRVPFISGGDAEDYGELIDAYEAGIDVMPGETLTDYINRIRKAEKRRKNKASGGLAYMLGE